MLLLYVFFEVVEAFHLAIVLYCERLDESQSGQADSNEGGSEFLFVSPGQLGDGRFLECFQFAGEDVVVASEFFEVMVVLFNLGVVVVCDLVDVVDGFDDVALDEFLVLLPHVHQVVLYFPQHSLQFAVCLLDLPIYSPVLPLQLV